MENNKFCYPRILHLYWNGSLPFLNYLTVISFKKYHPFWKINVYMTTKVNNEITWKTGEQGYKIKCYDYINELKNDSAVNIIDISNLCEELKIDKLHYTYQSDIVRIYFLSTVGGVWSDFDIIYIKNLENVFDKYTKDIMFKIRNNYFPIGFFVGTGKKNNVFNTILKRQLNLLKNKGNIYQKYGTTLYNNIFYLGNNINKNNEMKKKYSIEMLGKYYYLPYEWNQLNQLFNRIDMSQIKENTVGIHWFNGALIARKYVDKIEKLDINDFKTNCTLDILIEPYLKYKKTYN